MTRKSIDLPDLPTPDVVEALDFESIRSAILKDLNSRLDEQTIDLESEPLIKLIEAFAYRELLLRQRINDSAQAVMLATAQGNDLDNLAALLDVERQSGESDERFRKRVQLAHESYTAAGTAGAYEWHALDASQAVTDVTAQFVAPGKVDVVVMGTDGPLVAAELDKVRGRIQSDKVKPLTDQVTVRNARVKTVDVVASLVLFDGPDSATVQQQAIEAVRAYGDRVHRLGYDITVSGLISALHVTGVQRAVVHQPGDDVMAADDELTRLGEITVTFDGRV